MTVRAAKLHTAARPRLRILSLGVERHSLSVRARSIYRPAPLGELRSHAREACWFACVSARVTLHYVGSEWQCMAAKCVVVLLMFMFMSCRIITRHSSVYVSVCWAERISRNVRGAVVLNGSGALEFRGQ